MYYALLEKNFKKYPGDFYEQTIWDAARVFSFNEFKRHMEILAIESTKAFEELMSMEKYVWFRSQFCTYSKNHYITNNLSDSFNAWILEARYSPAVNLVDKIRIQIMEKFEHRKKI